MFKRACFLVNSKAHMYYRVAGINEEKAKRISLHSNDKYLTEAGHQRGVQGPATTRVSAHALALTSPDRLPLKNRTGGNMDLFVFLFVVIK